MDMNNDDDEFDLSAIGALPQFTPPDVKPPAAPAPEVVEMAAEAPAEVVIEGAKPLTEVIAETAPAAAQAVGGEAPAPSVEPKAAEAGVDGAKPVKAKDPLKPDDPELDDEEEDQDFVLVDRSTLDALRAAARSVQKEHEATGVDPGDLARVNAAVAGNQPMRPEAGPTGYVQSTVGEELVHGVLSAVGGAGRLVGAGFRAGGRMTASLASAIEGVAANSRSDSAVEPSIPALPASAFRKITDYRIEQAEKTAGAYESAMQQLWASGDLPNVRKQIEERARTSGLSVEDVMDKMKPNGEMADLHEKFVSAVAESPEAQNQKKVMDKSLQGWVRQYGRGQDELLNPETEGNPHAESLRDRLDDSKERMEASTRKTPIFDGEAQSNAEKLQEAIQRITEKLQEFIQTIRKAFGGRKTQEGAYDAAP